MTRGTRVATRGGGGGKGGEVGGVVCILHLTTAMGCLLGEFVDREARLVTPALRQDLQVLLSERRAGWG